MPVLPCSRHSAGNRRLGVAAVELAVSLPILMIFVFGTIELTNAIYVQQSLEICAFEGARVALLPETNVGNVEATCKRLLLSRRVKNTIVTVTPEDYPSTPYGTAITVSVETALRDNCLSPMLVLPNRKLVGTVTMMKEI